jgi:uncharacterized membrane protein YczE
VKPWTLVALALGLSCFGLGEALLVRSGLGNSPWTVLAQGVSRRIGISIGVATLGLSAVVLLCWIPLRERPGIGTLSNIVIIAAALQVGVDAIRPASSHLIGAAYLAAGLAAIGLGSGLYLTCGLGPGPRDGLMTGVHRRTNLPVSRVRLCLEVCVSTAGWLLGGDLGIGTVVFALLIGRVLAMFLALVGATLRAHPLAIVDE